MEHVTDQVRLLILVVLHCMEASWLPTVLNMLEDIPHWCPIVKDLVTPVSVGWVLKGLPLLHLTLWLLRDMCCTDKGSLPQPVRQQWEELEHLQQKSTSNIGRNGQFGVLERE